MILSIDSFRSGYISARGTSRSSAKSKRVCAISGLGEVESNINSPPDSKSVGP